MRNPAIGPELSSVCMSAELEINSCLRYIVYLIWCMVEEY